MGRKKSKVIPIAWAAGVGIPILTFCGSTLIKIWSVADSIATKTELIVLREDMVANFKRTDEAIAKSVDAGKKYTDEKAIQLKEDDQRYSDSIKLKMDAKYAELNGQFNLILSLLNDLKSAARLRR